MIFSANQAHYSRGGVAAIVLAAGCGSRFSAVENKLVADYRGQSLLLHAVDAALASRAQPTIVVTGYDRARVEATLDGLPITLVHNAGYASGLASSLSAGIAQVTAGSGALVLLGDMPDITPDILNKLITVFQGAPAGCSAVAPTRRGTRGNPVLLGRTLFPRIMQLRGDEGARRLLQTVDGVLDLSIDSDAAWTDVDTFEDLEALRAKTDAPT
jgi:molybdenum cofactor cytidylyltransferase